MKQNQFLKLIKQLGTPYYLNNNTALYHGDCLTLLSKFPKNSINSTITSPPYNIGKSYEKILPITQYIKWSQQWMTKIYNITKANGSFWLNVGSTQVKNKGHLIPLAYLLWNKNPFYFQQELVWHYGAGVSMRKYFSTRNEQVLWYVKNAKKYTFNLDSIRNPNIKYKSVSHGRKRWNNKGKNPTDVWYIPKITSGKNRHSKERTKHPAQTPEELFKRLILVSTNPNDLIIDPFVGSGTTCVIAHNLHRYSIGIDTNKKYLNMAITRLEQEKINPKIHYFNWLE